MKLNKIFIFILLLISVSSFSSMSKYIKEGTKIKIKKDINIRTKPIIIKSTLITYVKESDIYSVLDMIPKYIQIEVVSDSDRVGEVGWVYKTTCDIIAGQVIITGKGCTFRSNAFKSPNDKRYLKAGATGKILDMTADFWKVNRKKDSNWKTGWIRNNTKYVEVLK